MRHKLAVLVLAILGLVTAAACGDEPQSKRLLLLTQGPDGHPAGTHEYVAGLRRLAGDLAEVPGLEVVTLSADLPWQEGPDELRRADGAVLFLSEGAKWLSGDPRRLEAFAQLAQRGGGLSCLHWAMGTRDAQHIEGFVNLFGACHGGPDRKYIVTDTTLSPTPAALEILTGWRPFAIRDEFYYRLKRTRQGEVTPWLTALIDGQPEMVAWGWQRPDQGRSFGFSGLHFDANWERPEYRQLVQQGVLWTLKLPPAN